MNISEFEHRLKRDTPLKCVPTIYGITVTWEKNNDTISYDLPGNIASTVYGCIIITQNRSGSRFDTKAYFIDKWKKRVNFWIPIFISLISMIISLLTYMHLVLRLGS